MAAILLFCVAPVGLAQGAQSPDTPLQPVSSDARVQEMINAISTTTGETSRTAATGTTSEGEAARRPLPGVYTVSLPRRPIVATGAGQGNESYRKNDVEFREPPDEGGVIEIAGGEGPTRVIELLNTISLSTGWNVIASDSMEEKTVRLWANDMRPTEILEVLRFAGIYSDFDAPKRMLYVMPIEEYYSREFGGIEEATFSVAHADVVDMQAILTPLLSSNGMIIPDPRTGKLIVRDTADNLEEMRAAMSRLDVPLEPRVIQVNHLNAENLLESVQSLLSERGLAHVDARANTLMVLDLPARQQQISEMVEALDQQLVTQTWTLNYADAEEVMERLENIVPEEMGVITANEETHQISLTAIPARISEVDELIKTWDVKGRQVQIDAYLVAANVEIARNFGINWNYFGDVNGNPFALRNGPRIPDFFAAPEQGQNLIVGTLPYQIPLRNFWTGATITDINGDPVPNPEFQGNRISAIIDYLDQTDMIDVLQRPSVTVQDGETATFEQTQDEPYQEGGYDPSGLTETNNPNFNRVIPLRVQFVTVGTILEVEPRINDESKVLMKISAEDSDADPVVVVVGDQQSTIPSKRQSRVETSVLVQDSQTIVIAGLRGATVGDNVEKVPVLGDIPILGRLFKSTNKSHINRELMIFLTPTIVDEFTQPEATRLAKSEASITKDIRHAQKPILERAEDRLRSGKNEIGVSIGAGGEMLSEGKLVTIDDLAVNFAGVSMPDKTTVVIRAHPKAPQQLVVDVTERALEAGLKVEQDELAIPFVPTPRKQIR